MAEYIIEQLTGINELIHEETLKNVDRVKKDNLSTEEMVLLKEHSDFIINLQTKFIFLLGALETVFEKGEA